MNFVGIIAEYDPFHSGHALQLRMLRQRGASTIAVCMSTGVVQRGGVPILPEAVRVRAALAAGADLVVALPAPYAEEMTALYQEMAALQTPEARIYKALDNMEAVLQHNEAPLSTWEPNEYQLNLTYGQDKAAFSPVLSALRQALREETLRKLDARPD